MVLFKSTMVSIAVAWLTVTAVPSSATEYTMFEWSCAEGGVLALTIGSARSTEYTAMVDEITIGHYTTTIGSSYFFTFSKAALLAAGVVAKENNEALLVKEDGLPGAAMSFDSRCEQPPPTPNPQPSPTRSSPVPVPQPTRNTPSPTTSDLPQQSFKKGPPKRLKQGRSWVIPRRSKQNGDALAGVKKRLSRSGKDTKLVCRIRYRPASVGMRQAQVLEALRPGDCVVKFVFSDLPGWTSASETTIRVVGR